MESARPRAQLLGVAFAAADLLFEVDSAGRVAFALGAVRQVTQRDEPAFVGSSWLELVRDEDRELLEALAAGLEPGGRRGPLAVRLRPREGRRLSRSALLSVFRMPKEGAALSCAITLGAANRNAAEDLIDRDALEAQMERMLGEAEQGGAPVRLDLVQLEGLGQATARMPAAEAGAFHRKVTATLRVQSAGGFGATEMAPDRFALVRNPGADSNFANRLKAVGAGVFAPTVAHLHVENSQGLRAMRYALDRFIEQGPSEAAATFSAAVRQTMRDGNRFKEALSRGDFALVYQPIVHLQTRDGGLHHFEALARFDEDTSPAETIQLAEELGLITEFDLTVVGMVAKALAAAAPEVRIAANVSAASLLAPDFVGKLLAVTSRAGLRPRLLLEVTETQVLKDLAAANAAIARLRQAGHPICLDDFGAGAASLDYLRSLDIDYVKIDGRYIQGLAKGSRDSAILKHLVALCHELGVRTIAEMIETAEVEVMVRGLGVDLGQGWRFGKPLAQPLWSQPAAPVAARRRGVIEEWG